MTHIKKILQYKIQTKGQSRTHDCNAWKCSPAPDPTDSRNESISNAKSFQQE